MLFANYYQPDRVKNASFEEVDRHHTYNPTFTNRLLRSEFLKHGIELNNPDVNEGREIAFSILKAESAKKENSGVGAYSANLLSDETNKMYGEYSRFFKK